MNAHINLLIEWGLYLSGTILLILLAFKYNSNKVGYQGVVISAAGLAFYVSGRFVSYGPAMADLLLILAFLIFVVVAVLTIIRPPK